MNLSELQLNVTCRNMLVTTDKGDNLSTDLIICCTGLKVNSAAYASSFCESTHTQINRSVRQSLISDLSFFQLAVWLIMGL